VATQHHGGVQSKPWADGALQQGCNNRAAASASFVTLRGRVHIGATKSAWLPGVPVARAGRAVATSGRGQVDHEAGAAAGGGRLGTQAAAVALDDAARDGQAQAEAGLGGGQLAALLTAREGGEHGLEFARPGPLSSTATVRRPARAGVNVIVTWPPAGV